MESDNPKIPLPTTSVADLAMIKIVHEYSPELAYIASISISWKSFLTFLSKYHARYLCPEDFRDLVDALNLAQKACLYRKKFNTRSDRQNNRELRVTTSGFEAIDADTLSKITTPEASAAFDKILDNILNRYNVFFDALLEKLDTNNHKQLVYVYNLLSEDFRTLAAFINDMAASPIFGKTVKTNIREVFGRRTKNESNVRKEQDPKE